MGPFGRYAAAAVGPAMAPAGVVAGVLLAGLSVVLGLAAVLPIGPGAGPAAAASATAPYAAAASTAPERPAGDTLLWRAEIAGRDVAEVAGSEPLRLDAAGPLRITVTLTNATRDPLHVEDLRLEGRVLGIAFFRFGAGLDVVLQPGVPTTRTVQLRTTDLPRQAVGWLPGSLQVLGEDREVLAATSFPVDVRGSVLSAYGVFGFAALAVTVTLLGSLLLALRRGRLPANRWARGVRFAAAGAGLGLTLTVTLSSLRQVVPDADSWLPLVAGCAAAAFLLGYLLPGLTREEPVDEPSLRAAQGSGASALVPHQRRRSIARLTSLRRR